jgi:hypothetical protein
VGTCDDLEAQRVGTIKRGPAIPFITTSQDSAENVLVEERHFSFKL